MLDLFNINLNKKSRKMFRGEDIKSTKHFPSSIREWKNSVYAYNKNVISMIPTTTMYALDLIKAYFSIFNNRLERNMRTKRLLLRLRRLSSNKIYVSDGEFKHTNNKVIITLYVFNRQISNYELKLKKEYFKSIFKRRKYINEIISTIKYKTLESLKKNNVNKPLLLKVLNKEWSGKSDIEIYGTLCKYIDKFYKTLTRKILRKLRIYFYYKQLLFINKSKYNFTFLLHIQNYLEKIYNKNIEFNFVNIKRFYLNSTILSESITLKLTKNRRKILKFINNLKRKVKIKENKILLYDFPVETTLNLKQIMEKFAHIRKFVFRNLKYKHVTGFRLEASGRLTRRYTASRSVSKIRYKGNLLNIDSSYRGLSSIMLKSNLRSNLQYTKSHSKTRIGSFGIKSWVSGN